MSRPDVNPADYQSIVDSKPVKVFELTRHQLEQELCHAMQKMNEKFNNWHRGR